jgi:AbrB family looped-hinge helix DNA binding protein
MSLATLTTKGQLTIPKKVRELLDLHSGDKIEIVVTKNMEAVIRPVSKKVDDIFCRLYKANIEPATVGDMNRAIGNRMKGRFE